MIGHFPYVCSKVTMVEVVVGSFQMGCYYTYKKLSKAASLAPSGKVHRLIVS